jgi:hypothetical protein
MFLLLEEKLEKLLPLQEPREPTFQLRDLSKRLSAHTESEELLVFGKLLTFTRPSKFFLDT